MKTIQTIIASLFLLAASARAQQPSTQPVVVDNRNGSPTYHQVTAPTDFWQHTPFTLATGQAYVVFNSSTGALITPTASAFYAANPPPGGRGGGSGNVAWSSITGTPTTATGYGLTIGLSDLPTIPLASKVSGTLSIANGGTGAATLDAAKANLYTGFLKTVSTVGDGGGNSLESIPTTGMAVPQYIVIYVVAEDNVEGFLLVAGTDPQDKDVNNTTYFHVHPLDYNASTNAKVWVRKQ